MASILDIAAVISEHTGMDERIAWLQGKGMVHIYSANYNLLWMFCQIVRPNKTLIGHGQ